MNPSQRKLRIELLSITPDAEKVIERAGRTAYHSENKIDEGSSEKFIKMLIKRGHESVLEHASASFLLSGVSRAFTHQLVRHRLASYTQRSQRYVSENNFDYIIPPSIEGNPQARELFENCMEEARRAYAELQKMGIPKQDARFVLPNAVASQIVVTANFREWRHILTLRGAPDAQWEIREVAIEILKILRNYAPSCFCDFIIDEKKRFIRKIQLEEI